jgi:chromosome segregation ATPase
LAREAFNASQTGAILKVNELLPVSKKLNDDMRSNFESGKKNRYMIKHGETKELSKNDTRLILEAFSALKHDTRLLNIFFTDHVKKKTQLANLPRKEAGAYFEEIDDPIFQFEDKYAEFESSSLLGKMKLLLHIIDMQRKTLFKICNHLHANLVSLPQFDRTGILLGGTGSGVSFLSNDVTRLFESLRSVLKVMLKPSGFEFDDHRAASDKIAALEAELSDLKQDYSLKEEELNNFIEKLENMNSVGTHKETILRQQNAIDSLESTVNKLIGELDTAHSELRQSVVASEMSREKNAQLTAQLDYEKQVYRSELGFLKPEVERQMEKVQMEQRELSYLRQGISLAVGRFHISEEKRKKADGNVDRIEDEIKGKQRQINSLTHTNEKLTTELDKRGRLSMATVAALNRCKDDLKTLREDKTKIGRDHEDLLRQFTSLSERSLVLGSEVERLNGEYDSARKFIERLQEDMVVSEAEKASQELIISGMGKEKADSKESSMKANNDEISKLKDEIKALNISKSRLEYEKKKAVMHAKALAEKLKSCGIVFDPSH